MTKIVDFMSWMFSQIKWMWELMCLFLRYSFSLVFIFPFSFINVYLYLSIVILLAHFVDGAS